METRAMAISFFYAVGTAIGGITGPLLFGKLIESERAQPGDARLPPRRGADDRRRRSSQAVLGVEAAGRQLEDIAKPLTAGDAEAARSGARQPDGPEAGERRAPSARSARTGGERMSTGWSPFLSSPSAEVDETTRYLAREIDMLERAVREQGVLRRRELGRLVGCRYWGPGRFGRALRAAVRQGRIARPRRGHYGPSGYAGRKLSSRAALAAWTPTSAGARSARSPRCSSRRWRRSGDGSCRCRRGAYSARRPAKARPSVTSSAYSRSPPTGSPDASRVTADVRGAPAQRVGDVQRRRLAGRGRVGGEHDLAHRRVGALDARVELRRA